MKFRKVTLGEISKINKNSYKKSFDWKTASYLDTGNITRNKIETIVKYDLEVDKLPSRAKRIPEKNSILYSTVRPNQEHYGFMEKKYDNFLVSTGFAVIDVYDELADSKYIYYFLTQNEITTYLQKIGEDSVSTYPAIKPSDLEQLEILIPGKTSQRRVSKILSNIDKKIEVNNKIIDNLEAQAQGIFKSWFVDFERFADGDFVESDLGLIPKGWEVSTTGQEFDIEYGKNLPTKKLLSVGYPVYGGNGQIGFYSNYLYDRPRLLVSCRGAASGKVGLSKAYSFVTNNSLVFNERNEKYFYYYKHLFNRIQFENYVTGSAQPQLTIKNSLDIKVLVPSESDVLKFNKIVNAIFNLQNNLSEENNRLASIRDSLLPKLMAGEIDIANISIED